MYLCSSPIQSFTKTEQTNPLEFKCYAFGNELLYHMTHLGKHIKILLMPIL